MQKNPQIASDCPPTASGILLCLRMLTEESSSLNLRRSVLALRAAALVLEAEAIDGEDAPILGPRLAMGGDIQIS